MSIRNEVREIYGVEINPKVEDRFRKAIANKSNTPKVVRSLARTAYYLDYDMRGELIQRLGIEEGNLAMDDIEDEKYFEEELILNLLYIVSVWAHEAKQAVNAMPDGPQGGRQKRQALQVIDAFALRALEYWTLEPIFPQDSVPGLQQKQVSRLINGGLINQLGVIKLVKASKGKGESNTYGLVTRRDLSPEEMKAAFDSLGLLAETPDEQIAEFTDSLASVSEPNIYEDKDYSAELNW